MASRGDLVVDGAHVLNPTHRLRLPDTLAALAGQISHLIEAAGLGAPLGKELARTTGASPREIADVLSFLVRDGRIVRVAADYYAPRPAHAAFVARIEDHLRSHGTLRVDDARRLSGLSRKYLVPLLEDLDRRQVTKRRGKEERVTFRG